MKPHIALLIASVLASLMVQPDAIAQTLACRDCYPPRRAIRTDRCFLKYFGETNQGNRLRLDTCSLYSSGSGVAFTYLLGKKPVKGWISCWENGWYANGDFVLANSPASQGMMNFICQPQRTTSYR
jgi:hypothetical protein